ncbi:hypothetical protein [Paludisphaera rhizosphaerae]|uniref:hypothetical protein n=1 Tax=Paludisphaera rhizosphaerae TaxID=2711216 RepID=UPI0013ED5AED|nr:hypothetical protein [Paludisphaera rhizosphaerae]
MSTGQTPPELTIPIGMNLDEVKKDLAKLKELLAQAGQAGVAGFDDAKKSASGFLDVLGEFATHQGYQVVKDAAWAMAGAFDEAYQHIRGVAREFTQLQQAMTQVAALQGRSNSDKFTREQADLAVQASLKADEWTKFQEQFQSYGGAFIEGPNAKLNGDDATKYQQYVAEFAKARGLNPSEAAQLAGGLLQFQEGPTDASTMIDRFGKVFKTLERAPTPVPQLLPQMTRVMAQGASPEEASRMLAIMSEAMPGEEETGVTNVLKAIRNARLGGRGAELGVTKGMTPMQQVQAAAAAIQERVAAGEDQDALMAEYFPDIREYRGMSGFLNRGLRGGGFERTGAYQAETPSDWVSTELDAWEASDGGRRARLQAEEQWRRIINGQGQAAGEEAMQRARNALLAEDRFGTAGPSDAIRGLLSPIAGSRDDQLVRERAIQDALAQAQAAGVDVSGFSAAERNGLLPGMGAGFGQSAYAGNEMLVKLLEEIRDNTARTGPGAGRPLNVQPPNPRTRP